jgi:hypothetical protein
MRLHTCLSATLLTGLMPLAACAGLPVDVAIYDRTAGQLLPVYWHDGERHVVGEPGHEYELRVRNRTGGRVLAVASVDGVNVVSGRIAATDQGGYVIGPHDSVGIDGWRKSLDAVAAFYFTSLSDSYAARTGRPDNVGVIGVALFRERPQRQLQPLVSPSADAAAEAPAGNRSAKSEAGSAAATEDRLGTGHGQRLDSSAVYTRFERASDRPVATIRIFYDSYRNLVAQGVIPGPRYAQRRPDPFPGGFVPDP